MLEDKEIIEKYHFELKWASYFTFWYFVFCFFLSILISLYDEFNVTEEDFLGYRYYRKLDHSYLLIYLFLIQFYYFLYKGFRDVKQNEIKSSFFSKIFFSIRMLTIYLFFSSLVMESNYIPAVKFENIELLMLEQENKSTLIKDFLKFIKIRKN